ncbi:ABC transporter ATP-binding protein [Alphaproteobacteria bacterium]|nr:ABC transporter ATP-binding protein [Alphaproteobacteria bacterium]
MSEILRIENLEKSFGGVEVIKNFDLSIKRGSKTALIGPNGAGKTTVFNLISGVYPVDSGNILLEGADITTIPPYKRIRKGVARSFQNIRLMPHLSVIENVLMGQYNLAFSLKTLLRPIHFSYGKKDKIIAQELLESFNVTASPEEIVSNLPYGLQKRIEVVRALMAKPILLLLDEPTAGLNRVESDQLAKMLIKISNQGVTILLVEHNMHFVNNLVDHSVVINFGEKIYEGPPRDAQNDKGVREAYLGQD